MGFFRDISPKAALRDLLSYVQQDRPHKLLMLVFACAPPAIIFTTIYMDAKEHSIPPPPTVTYFENWPLNRSVEDSVKSIKAQQAEKDAYMEQQRAAYKAIGAATGMDVEKIDRENRKSDAVTRAANDKIFNDAVAALEKGERK